MFLSRILFWPVRSSGRSTCVIACGVIFDIGAHPRLHSRQLEHPALPDELHRQALLVSAAADGIARGAQVFRDLYGRFPRLDHDMHADVGDGVAPSHTETKTLS